MRGRFLGLTDVQEKDGGVLIAMSGGVDSAVAALLVREAGLRAVGLTMKNYCYGDTDVPDRSCCSVEAINDARRECDRLGIPHVVVDAEELFTREVIDNFLSEYENARTPNPCVRCNSIVRFKTLFNYADRLGIGYVATGHYARIFETESGTRYLARSSNRDKDQSYFLSGVRDDVLSRVVFPLGDYTKGAVREIAGSASMAVATKKESQEVCFVPDGTLRSFLESRGVPLERGRIENVEGDTLGSHEGLAAYTVGQRRHLGIATGVPQYVVELNQERNVVVVGGAEKLLTRELTCRLTWIDTNVLHDSSGVTAQIRYRHEGSEIHSMSVDGPQCRVVFAEAQRALSPGQTVVFYQGELVVGSGVIERA